MTIDQGTTSSRVIIFDERGNIICRVLKPFKQIYPFDGAIEHDPMVIYEDVVELMLEALKQVNIDYNDLIGVGITNQRETTVLWDKKTGLPIYNAIVWQSNQSKNICEELINKGYKDFINEKTGLLINPYFSASKIKWILDNVNGAKELMNEGRLMFGTIDSWLIYKLTGKHVTDYTNASRTMLFNIHTLKWDEELLDLFGINNSILPKVVDSNYNVGEIKDSRISDIVKLNICAILGDQQASLVGHACFNPGKLKITYGTGSFMLLNTGDIPFKSKNGLLTTIAYSINGTVSYALEGSVFVAGSAFQFIRDNLEIVKSLDDDEFNQEDSNGVIFVPALTGLGAPYWNSNTKGAIYGLTRATTKKDIAIATIDGVALMNNDVLQTMKDDTGIEFATISVDGGASLNPYLMQRESDYTGNKITTISTSEATSLGVYYLVMLNNGLIKSIEEINNLYKPIRCYSPSMNKNKIEKIKENWKKAVNATIEFSK